MFSENIYGNNKNSGISENSRELADRVKNLIDSYEKYIDATKDYKRAYSVFIWHIEHKIKNEGYVTLEQVITHLKDTENKSVKHFIDNYIMPPLVAGYIEDRIPENFPIETKEFVDRLLKEKSVYGTNESNKIKIVLRDLLKKRVANNPLYTIEINSVRKFMKFLKEDELLK